MKIHLPEKVGEGLAAYLRAMVAYRRILRGGLALLIREHGQKSVLAYFSTDSFAPLVDANDENFVDRARLSQLAKFLKGAAAGRFLNNLYRQIESEPDLAEFRSLMGRTNNRAIAEDLPHFLEHRIRETRRELRQYVTTEAHQMIEQDAAHA
jgi:hypothetical protein